MLTFLRKSVFISESPFIILIGREKMLSDKEIIALFFQRNEWAIREMSYKYGAYCTAIAKNILDSYEDCQECVNDTWHNAWNAIPPKCPECLKSFLGRITRNLSYNKLKSLTASKHGGGKIIIFLKSLKRYSCSRKHCRFMPTKN